MDDIIQNNREYFLLEDSTLDRLPKHIIELIKQSFTNNFKEKSDILAVLIIGIALESGFSPKLINTTTTKTTVTELSDNYIQNGIISFNKHFLEQNTKLPITFWQLNTERNYNISLKLASLSVDFKLLITLISDGLCIILTPIPIVSNSIIDDNLMDQQETSSYIADAAAYTTEATTLTFIGRSLFLPTISKYIPLPINIQYPEKSFRNLKDLSIQLKNEIFLPIRNTMLSISECNFPYSSLLGVPIECLQIIMKYLNRNSKIALSRTCKQLNMNCKNC